MRNTSPILENFIQMNYPGMNLPPLWEVIYQEAVRGHHLLFNRNDAERYDAAVETHEFWLDEELTDELETIILNLVSCNELQTMVRIIDHLPDTSRRTLYFMYRRVLWMWRNYVKDQLN